MPALDAQCRVLHGAEIDSPLLARDGGRRLEGGAEHERHAVRNSPEDAAAVIGLGDDAAIVHAEGVVGLAAAHGAQREARAEFQALDGRDAENDGGNAVLHSVKYGIAQSGRETEHSTFHNAAKRISLRFRRRDSGLHLLPCRF